jgi:hypothetical protein
MSIPGDHDRHFKNTHMAQSKDNILVKGLSGTIARLLTFRQRAGKTIVSKLLRPSTATPSDKAAAVRAKFTTSVAYAKAAVKDPAIKAGYQAVAKDGQTAYNMALADAFQSPQISGIDAAAYHGAAGDAITVKATDDFKVAAVKVSIFSAAGALLEQGNTVMQINEVDWLYTATQANAALAGSKITAEATDLPGNSTSLSLTL